MKETGRLALILFLITAISAFILSVSNNVTAPIIAEADALKDEEAKLNLLPEGDEFEEVEEGLLESLRDINSNIISCDKGLKDGEIIGYIFKTSSKGYGGDIEFMVALSTEGKVEGIEILNHEETPGLGANIIRPSFKTSFEGKNIESGLVAAKEPKKDNEVQAIASATITTDAIVDEVNGIIDGYKEISGGSN